MEETMAGQEDLISEVKSKLQEYKNKERDLELSRNSFELSKIDLEASRTKLTEHMNDMRALFETVQVELDGDINSNLPEAVADSLSGSKTADNETIEEGRKPSKTAVSDELDVPKKPSRKSSKPVKSTEIENDQLISPELEEKIQEEIEKVVVPDVAIEEIVEPVETAVEPLAVDEEVINKQEEDDELDKLLQAVKIPVTKSASSGAGLWDLDDDEDDDDLFGPPSKKNASNVNSKLSDSTDVDEVQF